MMTQPTVDKRKPRSRWGSIGCVLPLTLLLGCGPAATPSTETPAEPAPSAEGEPMAELGAEEGLDEDLELVVTGDQITVDGLEMRALECTLSATGVFAMVEVVSALSERKADFDRCAPAGDAFLVRWVWTTEQAEVEVSQGGTQESRECVGQAMGMVAPSTTGTCGGVLLVGEQEGAYRAAEPMAALPAEE